MLGIFICQLLEVAKEGRSEELLELLANGADIERRDEVRRCFLWCRMFDDIGFWRVKIVFHFQRNRYIYTLVGMHASLRSCYGNLILHVLSLLWRRRRHNGKREQDESTALIYAAWKGHADCVQLLLDAGADKEAKDEVCVACCIIDMRIRWFCSAVFDGEFYGL